MGDGDGGVKRSSRKLLETDEGQGSYGVLDYNSDTRVFPGYTRILLVLYRLVGSVQGTASFKLATTTNTYDGQLGQTIQSKQVQLI